MYDLPIMNRPKKVLLLEQLVENICWLRGLASSEKLAKYWFMYDLCDSQGESLKPP